jgi:hypothetical protein
MSNIAPLLLLIALAALVSPAPMDFKPAAPMRIYSVQRTKHVPCTQRITPDLVRLHLDLTQIRRSVSVKIETQLSFDDHFQEFEALYVFKSYLSHYIHLFLQASNFEFPAFEWIPSWKLSVRNGSNEIA